MPSRGHPGRSTGVCGVGGRVDGGWVGVGVDAAVAPVPETDLSPVFVSAFSPDVSWIHPSPRLTSGHG